MNELAETKLKDNNCLWTDQIQSYDELVHEEEIKIEKRSGIKLGWVKGVLVPCLLSIWGVMLFLRMPWILGQAGIFDSLVIIFISLIIILITTFSLSAISTNGKVKGGGLYFIISRSIGPEFGASIGILLAFANTISAAMNTIGFATSLKSLLNSKGITIIDGHYAFRIFGIMCIIMQSILCCIGMDREAEVQNALLIAIIVGIFNVLIGSFIGPTNLEARASGFTGLSMETFKTNWYSDYRPEKNIMQSFFSIFAVFFPSVTGIQAGANISGDLKDPSDSIPKGTLLSILITIISYVALIVVPGAVQLREASGSLSDYQNGTYLDCSFRNNCTKGLYHDENLMQSIALWPITIYFGCFGATISTALTALISVPKLLQRMGQDEVYPLLKHLAKGYGSSQEPYRAHVFAMIISSTLIVIVEIFYGYTTKYLSIINLSGELNEFGTLVSTIYLSAYALLNLCTFHVAYFKPLGWRPSYKFYNKWISLFGSIVCIAIVVIINTRMSVIIICIIYVLYNVAAKKKNDLNWGSSKQAQQIKTIIENAYKTNGIQYHVKNYLLNVTVLSGNPQSRKKLVTLAHLITSNNNGLQMCVYAEKRTLTNEQKKTCLDKGIQWLKSAGIKSLYIVVDNIELDTAVNMAYTCGHGTLRSNIVLVGFKSDWLNCPDGELQTFFNIFNVGNKSGMATIMVRVSSTEKQNFLIQDFKHLKKQEEELFQNKPYHKNQKHQKVYDCFLKVTENDFSFINNNKEMHGTVDVWWLYNDGGLALIIAHILKSSNSWKNCKFRIFGVTNKFEHLSREKNKLIQLLTMYRLNFDYLDIILTNKPDPTTMTYFTSLLEYAVHKGNKLYDYKLNQDHVANTLFLRDLIELHSLKSDLIILSTPRTNGEVNIIFMCWIEAITRGLPPCIIINGNTGPVFTVNA